MMDGGGWMMDTMDGFIVKRGKNPRNRHGLTRAGKEIADTAIL
jgi:hypothetical protein